ncbi:hypothetical protein PILCRDRAFT_10030 [Piloderma croceum F 1598]|uniref:Uncharacterized protein n=1 Tax=Piloderma croceum (strain F 1598) TaxID=765440 RepID=A0A0C3FJA1_PILCF|nr:hypothetical protein PILCRDRAFT_10030 [Piloderma croceum F 1598]
MSAADLPVQGKAEEHSKQPKQCRYRAAPDEIWTLSWPPMLGDEMKSRHATVMEG